jgi:hypothetical protein
MGCSVAEKSAPNSERESPRAFSLRAIVLGLLGAAFVACYTYYNDFVVKQTALIGSSIPFTLYALFFLFLVFVNPLLKKVGTAAAFIAMVAILAGAGFVFLAWLLGTWWPVIIYGALTLGAAAAWTLSGRSPLRVFSAGEMVVVLGLTVVAGGVVREGGMAYLPSVLVLPDKVSKNNTDWQKSQPLNYVDKKLFPEHDPADDVYEKFVRPDSPKELPQMMDESISLRDWGRTARNRFVAAFDAVPWSYWTQAAVRWLPLAFLLFLLVISMCKIVHKQWSENEQLAYPIAEFSNMLIRNERGRTWGDVFYQKKFWIPFGLVLAFHALKGIQLYVPQMVKIDLQWNLVATFSQMDWYSHASLGHAPSFATGKIFLTVVAFSFFLPAEIGFSFGISQMVMLAMSYSAYSFGFVMEPYHRDSMLTGAFLAVGGVILYTGRYYYWAVLKRAFWTVGPNSEADEGTAWACRVFLASVVGVTYMLTKVFGLDWMVASVFTFVFGLAFLVMARISAETGMPLLQTQVMPWRVLSNLFGANALGPRNLYVSVITSAPFTAENQEALSPFVVNSLRLAERNKVPTGRLALGMTGSVAIALVLGAAAVLYITYDRGGLYWRATGTLAKEYVAQDTAKAIYGIKRVDKLERSTEGSLWSRRDLIDTKPGFVKFIAIGAFLVIVNSTLRLRYIWWPISSMLFVVWGVHTIDMLAWSFLLGWIIKSLVMKIGGGRAYQDLKPIFAGIIMADLLGGFIMGAYGTSRFFMVVDPKTQAYNIMSPD